MTDPVQTLYGCLCWTTAGKSDALALKGLYTAQGPEKEKHDLHKPL